MKRGFPKEIQKVIHERLTPDEWRIFNRAIHGKFYPTDKQLAHWKSLGGYYELALRFTTRWQLV
jgi:hypothetical protein